MSRLFRDIEGGVLTPGGSVVCIGAFDGLHLGHRALLRHAQARARALGLPLVAVSSSRCRANSSSRRTRRRA